MDTIRNIPAKIIPNCAIVSVRLLGRVINSLRQENENGMTKHQRDNVIEMTPTKSAEQVFIERLSMVTEEEREEVLRRIAAGVSAARMGGVEMTA